jgi:hypothetical protein
VVRPGGKVVLSCLPLELPGARGIFLASASERPDDRWSKVRNVTTSERLMEMVAEMAGWRTVRWHNGDVPSFPLLGDGRLVSLGQSVQVLERPEG